MDEINERALELLDAIGVDLQLSYFKEWVSERESSVSLRARAQCVDDVIAQVRKRINTERER